MPSKAMSVEKYLQADSPTPSLGVAVLYAVLPSFFHLRLCNNLLGQTKDVKSVIGYMDSEEGDKEVHNHLRAAILKETPYLGTPGADRLIKRAKVQWAGARHSF